VTELKLPWPIEQFGRARGLWRTEIALEIALLVNMHVVQGALTAQKQTRQLTIITVTISMCP
jgi:hypothetical protein